MVAGFGARSITELHGVFLKWMMLRELHRGVALDEVYGLWNADETDSSKRGW